MVTSDVTGTCLVEEYVIHNNGVVNFTQKDYDVTALDSICDSTSISRIQRPLKACFRLLHDDDDDDDDELTVLFVNRWSFITCRFSGNNLSGKSNAQPADDCLLNGLTKYRVGRIITASTVSTIIMTC